MSSHSRILEWTAMLRTPLPALSTPQATVLALWSVGQVLARSSALTAVAAFLAMGLRRPKKSGRGGLSPTMQVLCRSEAVDRRLTAGQE
jgi:hypothetical protein